MAHCSRHTVRDVLQAAKKQGISWPPLRRCRQCRSGTASPFRTGTKHPVNIAEPDYPYIHRELARSGVTPDAAVGRITARTCQEAGKRPYMSTQFGERYRRWGTNYKSDHAHPAQAGRCHAGRLGRRYHSPPGPGYRANKVPLICLLPFCPAATTPYAEALPTT